MSIRLAAAWAAALVIIAVAPGGCAAGRADPEPPAVAMTSLDVNKPVYQKREYLGRSVPGHAWHSPEALAKMPTASRAKYEPIVASLKKLGVLRPAITAADIGAGDGTLTFLLAREIRDGRPPSDSGCVYSIEIQPSLVGYIAGRSSEKGVINVVPVLGTATSLGLPRAVGGDDSGHGLVDLAVIVDAYHEFSEPAAMQAAVARCLRAPGDGREAGVVAVVEFATEKDAPVSALHRTTRPQLVKEWQAAGYEVAAEDASLPKQHLVVFRVRREAGAATPGGTP